MSHPGEISCRCSRTISRIRRRMRLRFTALPSAFLMLHPNRLSSRPLARRKTANSRLVRRRPSRYTASYSDRRTRRAVRGKSCRGVSDARKTVAPLLAACRKYLPSTLALHSSAKSMLLMAAPHVRLKSAFRQRSLSSAFRSISICTTSRAPGEFRPANSVLSLERIAHPNETMSLDDPRTSVKERRRARSKPQAFSSASEYIRRNIRRKIANHPRETTLLHLPRLLLALLLVLPASSAAQEAHNHAAPEKLGVVSFPISCRPEVQQQFDRGVALLHSFAYADARNAFQGRGRTGRTLRHGALGNRHDVFSPALGSAHPARDSFERAKGNRASPAARYEAPSVNAAS